MEITIHNTVRTFCRSFVTLLMVGCMVSCSNDDEPSITPEPQEFSGSFVTSVPSMPGFPAAESTNTAKITWLNPGQTQATVNLGAFTIATGMEGRDYEIGAMEITGVICSKEGDGTIVMKNSSFTCQAGAFATTGSFEGTLSSNGELTFTIVYRPGSMPMDVQSVFKSK